MKNLLTLFYKKEKQRNRQVITIFGFIKIKYKKYKIRNRDFLENVFHKSNNKKVLISYVTSPFVNGCTTVAHSCDLECYTVAQIFDELGFQVDVVSYLIEIDSTKLKEYDIVYGFGEMFNKSLAVPTIQSIYYGTGCSVEYSNKVTLKKAQEFYLKTGLVALESVRYCPIDSTSVKYLADLIISLGNKFVANTYKIDTIKQNIKNLNCFYFDTYDIDIQKKNFYKIKNNFLWFGSLGALHKGLDIVIDIFKSRDDINLSICGFKKSETQFNTYYKDVLTDNKYNNIKILQEINYEIWNNRYIWSFGNYSLREVGETWN